MRKLLQDISKRPKRFLRPIYSNNKLSSSNCSRISRLSLRRIHCGIHHAQRQGAFTSITTSSLVSSSMEAILCISSNRAMCSGSNCSAHSKLSKCSRIISYSPNRWDKASIEMGRTRSRAPRMVLALRNTHSALLSLRDEARGTVLRLATKRGNKTSEEEAQPCRKPVALGLLLARQVLFRRIPTHLHQSIWEQRLHPPAPRCTMGICRLSRVIACIKGLPQL